MSGDTPLGSLASDRAEIRRLRAAIAAFVREADEGDGFVNGPGTALDRLRAALGSSEISDERSEVLNLATPVSVSNTEEKT